MRNRSLRPQLNQIRAWVRQGRTDAWIAHQLEVTVQQIQGFKREQGLEPGADAEGVSPPADFDDEIDLRAEDDALIAAELDAAEAERSEDEEDEEDQDDQRGAPRQAPPQTRRTRWTRAAQGRRSTRGHLRPRRRGLRAVARSRGPGRSGLRRVLGRPSSRRGHDRGGPDRDPARGRGIRGRRVGLASRPLAFRR